MASATSVMVRWWPGRPAGPGLLLTFAWARLNGGGRQAGTLSAGRRGRKHLSYRSGREGRASRTDCFREALLVVRHLRTLGDRRCWTQVIESRLSFTNREMSICWLELLSALKGRPPSPPRAPEGAVTGGNSPVEKGATIVFRLPANSLPDYGPVIVLPAV